MVVHEDDDRPLEMATDKSTNDGRNKYVILNNHIREVQPHTNQQNKQSTSQSTSDKDTESPKSKKAKKPTKNITYESGRPTYAQLVSNQSAKDTTMSSMDLEELRNVYNKCKSVLKKFETKYGHLLDLDGENNQELSTNTEVCTCSANKKIIFDDNGGQTVKETPLDKHICANKKVKRKYSDLFKSDVEVSNVQVEYEPMAITLSDDLVTLEIMLQNPNLKVKQRNEIIKKIRAMKVERINEIRFNRPSLREKLLVQPTEVMEFKGSNLFTLPGYPDGKPIQNKNDSK